MAERKHADVIRQWAADKDAMVECRRKDGAWMAVIDPAWYENDEYRIRPAPKKKVEMWQWAYKYNDRWQSTSLYFATEPEAKKAYAKDVVRIDGSRIEVEAD